MKGAERYRCDWEDVQVLPTDGGLEVIAPLTGDLIQGRIALTPATIPTTPPASR